MKYTSKGYVFDDDVRAVLDGLKAKHGSYNKGLRIFFSLGTDVQDAGKPEKVQRAGKSKSKKTVLPDAEFVKATELIVPQNETQKGAQDLGGGRKIWTRN